MTSTPTVVALSGSPSPTSRTAQLIPHVAPHLRHSGFAVDTVHIRELPAEEMFAGHVQVPAIAEAVARVERAVGVVIATPIYKAAYTGMLKSFLDVLPQTGLTGKTVLPLATGGSMAHVLAIDYALRPVLMSLNARHVATGLFILDKHIHAMEGGGISLDEEMQRRLDDVVAAFVQSLSLFSPAAAAPKVAAG